MEKGFAWIIVFLIISLVITGTYLLLRNREAGETSQETEQAQEAEEDLVYDESLCEQVTLNVDKVDCVPGEQGIRVMILRREDTLGQATIKMSVTDELGEVKVLKKLNFTKGSTQLNVNNAVAGAETNIVLELIFFKDEKKFFCPEINETFSCKIEEENETSTSSTEVPNPIGSIRAIDIRDEFGEYYCGNITNASVNPKHKIRVYTYQKINNSEVLSEKYIESKEISDVCDYYPGLEEVYYSIKWEWDVVENVSGYYVYQYYSDNKNITRDYDYTIRIVGNNLLRDTGLELWNEV